MSGIFQAHISISKKHSFATAIVNENFDDLIKL